MNTNERPRPQLDHRFQFETSPQHLSEVECPYCHLRVLGRRLVEHLTGECRGGRR